MNSTQKISTNIFQISQSSFIHILRVREPRRAVLEKNKNAEIADALKTVKEGMIVDTQVRAVNSWGVFVSYNGLDMLVHVSDLDFGRVKQPSDLVTVGQTLKCKIIKIDI